MGLSQLVKATYQNKYNADAIRQLVLPAGASIAVAANAAGSTYGAWVDVALAATVLVDTLVVGVFVANPSATDEFTVQIGSCLAAGVNYANAAAVNAVPAAIIAAARQEVAVDYQIVVITAVGEYAVTTPLIPLYAPIWIPAGVGILGRCYGVTAAAVTASVRVACVQNFS